MQELTVQGVILAIYAGTLLGIIYSLRLLVLMERRIERIEGHIERLVGKVLAEELKIEKGIGRKKK